MTPSRLPTHLRAVPRPKPVVTDDEILEAFETESAEFGNLLYDHLLRTIDGTLLRVMGERVSEHDDLVQSSFEQIIVSLARGKYQRACNLRSWAAKISSRVGLNAIRSRRTQRKYFDVTSDQAERSMGRCPRDLGRTVESRSSLEQVRSELSALSQERAEAVLLHDVLGHELTEVAALTGVTVAAAQSRLVRGRKELHRRLRERGLLNRGEES